MILLAVLYKITVFLPLGPGLNGIILLSSNWLGMAVVIALAVVVVKVVGVVVVEFNVNGEPLKE